MFYTKWKTMEDRLEGLLIGFDVILQPSTATYIDAVISNPKLAITRCLDFLEVGTFASRINVGKVNMFEFVRCFSIDVWALILCSLLVLSLISKLNYSEKIDSFFEHFWQYFMILLKNSVSKSPIISKKRNVMGIWFLAVFVLSVAFTAFLMDHLIRAAPVDILDDLQLLAAHPEIKILVKYDHSMVGNPETDLAKALKQRTQIFFDVSEISGELITGIKNGSFAYVNTRLSLIDDLNKFSLIDQIINNQSDLAQTVHISEDSGGLEPYFILTCAYTPWILSPFNKM